MSYSLIVPCGNCKKLEKCVDLHILSGAVSAIHQIGQAKGHLGSGSITLACNNVEPEDKK